MSEPVTEITLDTLVQTAIESCTGKGRAFIIGTGKQGIIDYYKALHKEFIGVELPKDKVEEMEKYLPDGLYVPISLLNLQYSTGIDTDAKTYEFERIDELIQIVKDNYNELIGSK
jgi:hypothetical protein